MTPAELADAFAAIGIAHGDDVIIHSAYRSLQPFDGSPVDVVAALRSVIGDGGNIMLPTFNYSRPLPEPYYDRDETPARTGAVVELGRKLPGAVRSLHPTHSVAVIGPDAEALTKDHLKTRAFGIGSPIDLLAKRGGKILLVGVANTSNSTLHVAEEHAGLPKQMRPDAPPTAKVLMPGGEVIDHVLDPSPSCSAGFEAAAFSLRQKNLIRDGRAGRCLMQMMPGQAVIDTVVRMLRDDSAAMLCTNPNCASCSGVRTNLTGS